MSEQERYKNIINALRAKAAEILPPGSQLSLYGSRARGDARPGSDWDLQILIPGDEKMPMELWDKYAWPFEQLGYDWNEDFSPRLYSFSGWKKRHFLPFYQNVENDKTIIYRN